MTASDSKLSGVPGRYAQALFDLARDAGGIEKVGADLDALDALIAKSDELAAFIASPLYDAADQEAGLDALMKKTGTGALTANFVRLAARNRRLALLPDMIAAYRALMTSMRGELSAEVTSAAQLSAAQLKKIAGALKGALGSDVQIENTVDPSIMGGLVVRVGSRMIDTSVKTRLNTLKMMLKGA